MSGISHASLTEVIRPIYRTFHTSRLDIIRLGRRVGIGAEGEVYEIQDSADIERPSFKPVLLALLIAFFIGMMMNPGGSMCGNALLYVANVE